MNLHPMELFKLMFILLPTWMFEEGLEIFSKFLKKEEGRLDLFLETSALVLAILVIVLILQGYPVI